MNLSEFTSLIEILTAFNFAYALADSFTEKLNTKVINAFNRIQENIENIRAKIELAMKSVYEVEKIDISVINTEEEIESCKNELNNQRDQFSEIADKIKHDIRRAGLTLSFKFLCFYNALFCLLLFIPIGFMSSDSQLYQNSCSIKLGLFGTALYSIGFQIRWIYIDKVELSKKALNPRMIGYRRTLYNLILTCLIFILLYGLNHFWFEFRWNDIYSDTILIFLSLFSPSLHFLYYFYRACKNAVVKSNDYAQKLDHFECTYDEWYKLKIESSLDFHRGFRERELGAKEN